MSKPQVILIAVGLVGIGLYGWLRSGSSENTEREVDPNSKEARAALGLVRQLAESTNYLAECLSPRTAPIARHALHQRAVRLGESTEITLKQASWSGDYFRVEIRAVTKGGDTNSHWFLLTAGEDGQLRLMGVQN